jgi:excisionase family DNA binding protein
MSQQTLHEPLLTAEQIAQMLNVQRSTVYEWAQMGYIPCIRLGTGKKKPLVRFSQFRVQEWLKQKEVDGRTKRVPEIS